MACSMMPVSPPTSVVLPSLKTDASSVPPSWIQAPRPEMK